MIPDQRCAREGCTETVGRLPTQRAKAKREGWFFTRMGFAYCPDHKPSEWVRKL